MANFNPPFLRLPDEYDDYDRKYNIERHSVSINSTDRDINKYPDPNHFVVYLNGNGFKSKDANLMINPMQVAWIEVNTLVLFCDTLPEHRYVVLQIDEINNIPYNTTTNKNKNAFINLYLSSNVPILCIYVPGTKIRYELKKDQNRNKLTVSLLDKDGNPLNMDNIDFHLLLTFGIKRYHL